MRYSIRKRSTKSRENLTYRKHINFWLNRKGATPHRKIGLPLNSLYFYSYESNYHFAATITFDYVSITAFSQVLTIVCGKILYEHCHSR